MNLPTMLTLIRIIAVPILFVIFYLPFSWANYLAAAIFAVASFTDWLDGYLARNMSLHTSFGAFLDPVADKLLVAIALVIIVGEHWIWGMTIPAAIIIGREIVISALREWMAELGKRTNVRVIQAAKFKTAIQMLAILLLLLYRPGMNEVLLYFGVGLLYIAVVLTIWSMVSYLKAAWPDLTLAMKNK